KLDVAESEFRALLAMSYQPARSHYGLGRVAEARGDRERAIAEYRRALALDPNLSVARKALEALMSGRRRRVASSRNGVATKIRSVSDGSAWGGAHVTSFTAGGASKIRSVSDGCAWGWGPMRIKKWRSHVVPEFGARRVGAGARNREP
ncbi:MAG: tetratricopeptide repeat protein, partial [Acidobacteria bacterium]|nr:tetratricopeptide repeat protein [Acidobacteriota bacterium]